MVKFREFLILIFLLILNNCNGQEINLLTQLKNEIKIDKYKEINAKIKDVDSFCKIDISYPEYNINVNKVLEILIDIEKSKDTSLIEPIKEIQNQFESYYTPYWNLSDTLRFTSDCCVYLKSHYDIIMGLEMTAKSLKLNQFVHNPEYLFLEFKKVRNFWLYLLSPPEHGVRRVKSKLQFKSPFLIKWSDKFYGQRVNLGIVTPYLDSLEEYIVKDLIEYINNYDRENIYYVYKFRFTKDILAKSKKQESI